MTTSSSSASPARTADIHTPPVKSSRLVQVLTFTFIGIVLFLALAIAWAKHSSKKKNSDNSSVSNTNTTDDFAKTTAATPKAWVLDHKIEVDFTSDFSNIVPIESGMFLSFSGATVPYEVINSKGEKGIGQKDEDASPQIPNSQANMHLKFRSTNGKNGHLTINVFASK
jgi:hypothetical protein